MIELPKKIDGFKKLKSWLSEVAFPPFETNLTRVYEKNIDPHQGAAYNERKRST